MTVTCPNCDETLPRRRDLGMHDRVVHYDDALHLFNDTPEQASE